MAGMGLLDFLDDLAFEVEDLETRRQQALQTLKANPLRPGPWMTPAAQRNWPAQLCTASGAAQALDCWGVREALRFRAVSRACRDAVQVGRTWAALMRLATKAPDGAQPHFGEPSPEDWAGAYEKVMRFCLQEGAAFEIRLELEGVDPDLEDEFGIHGGLRFGTVHISRAGAVACLQLGYTESPHAVSDIQSAAEDCDWSTSPTRFREQLLRSTVLRAALHYRGRKVSFVEVRRGPDGETWPEDQIATCGARMLAHPRYPNWCCKFALHLQLQIPTALFAHLVFPELGMTHAFGIHRVLIPSPPAVEEGRSTALWLVGSIWHSAGVAGCPEAFENGSHRMGSYFEYVTYKFSVEFPAPIEQACKDAPECMFLFEPDKVPPDATCLRFSMPLDLEEALETLRPERPDLVSLWALDRSGRTHFQLHGLMLVWVEEPDALVDKHLASSSSKRALASQDAVLFYMDLEAGLMSLVWLLPAR